MATLDKDCRVQRSAVKFLDAAIRELKCCLATNHLLRVAEYQDATVGKRIHMPAVHWYMVKFTFSSQPAGTGSGWRSVPPVHPSFESVFL